MDTILSFLFDYEMAVPELNMELNQPAAVNTGCACCLVTAANFDKHSQWTTQGGGILQSNTLVL